MLAAIVLCATATLWLPYCVSACGLSCGVVISVQPSPSSPQTQPSPAHPAQPSPVQPSPPLSAQPSPSPSASCGSGFMPLEEMRMLLGEGIVGKLRVTHKRQQITPAMRFTCTGWITKWIIGVAWLHSDTFYPELQLWRSSGGDTYRKINGTHLSGRGDTSEEFNVTVGNGIVLSGGIYEYDNFESIPFQAGDILGAFIPPNAHSKLRLLSVRGHGPTNYYLTTGNSNKSLYDSIDLKQQNLIARTYHPLVSVSIEELLESTEIPTRLTPTTSPPPPSSPSDTDSPRSGTGTEPGQGHSDGQEQSDEQSGNQEEERLLRGLGVGLGTVIVVVFVLCVVVVVGIFYFSKRARRKIDQVNRATSEMPLRSLSTPTSPRSPSSTSSPSPPTQSNALSPVATQSSIPLKCVAGKPDYSSDSYSSKVTVSATIEIEIEDLETTAAEEDTHKKKPSRSCLSSDSDSSQGKSRRGLSVSLDSDNGSQPHPPPPLPPRENNEEAETPPPRQPKPLLPCNESDHKERGGEETGNGVSGEDGDSRQVLEQNAAMSGDHGNEEQVSPGVGEG